MTKFKTLTLKERIGIAKKAGKKARRRAVRFGKATKIRAMQAQRVGSQIGKGIGTVSAAAGRVEKASAEFAKKHPASFGDDLFFASRKRKRGKRRDESFF